jgi:site-specific DNA-adenine methylase
MKLSQNKSCSMTVPQPFQYQGSKRALAPLILQYLPVSTTRLVEPFCGSAALSIATAARGRAGHVPRFAPRSICWNLKP